MKRDELTAYLIVNLGDTQLKGKLGFLQLSADVNEVDLGLAFAVDLEEEGATGDDAKKLKFTELGNIDVGSSIDDIFSDIKDLAAGCRFHDCTHTSEYGCAVLEAVHNGELSQARHQSYLKLFKESEHYQLSYVEKRRKDRKFGQFIKTVKKDLKKYKKR